MIRMTVSSFYNVDSDSQTKNVCVYFIPVVSVGKRGEY